MRHRRLAALLIGNLALPAFGDEGMWTFHDFPRAVLQQRYGMDMTSAWLDRVRMSTVRLSGCTGSFVSPEGLILTNHHCAAACLDENSTSQRSLTRDGFLARTRDRAGGGFKGVPSRHPPVCVAATRATMRKRTFISSTTCNAPSKAVKGVRPRSVCLSGNSPETTSSSEVRV